MGQFRKLLVTLALSMAAFPLSAVEFPEPKIVKLSERVHVLLGPVQHANKKNQGYMINSTVIVGDKGVILVEPGGTDEVGRFIKQHVKKISAKPITHVFNTHSHGDHYLGNIAYPEATIVSSEKCRDSINQMGEEWVGFMESMVGRKFPHTKPVPASMVFPPNSKTRITLNGVEMLIWVPPGSHTDADLMIYLPAEKVLVTGDILVSGVVPTFQFGSIRNWLGVLNEIEKTDTRVFVPGHGPLMNLGEVKAMHGVIARFYSDVKQLYRSYLDGKVEYLTEIEIRKKLDLSAWNRLERTHEINRNINTAWLEAEQELFK